MFGTPRLFRNRKDAGRQLAARIAAEVELRDPVVLGIPRGGVITADVIARELGGEADVVLSRKLPAPYQPELAIGAVAETGEVFMSSQGRRVPGVDDAYISRERDRQLAEIHRRRELIRNVRPAAALRGRTAIVADDGIATGSTMVAALQGARLQEPAELVAAVPVAPHDAAHIVGLHCDRYICLHTPSTFYSISQFYEDFQQVDDEQMLRTLRHAANRRTTSGQRAGRGIAEAAGPHE